ncbi:hypothetical protein AXE80_03650 [Wenyingzhuangia fucanilytica]|uniref:Uncharacterized protein n=1 Tax=Wenyingzhuangia fucanilytica TaxID=1790137 RepID=A0A1B1Y3V6_9FLAO|nr:hypothetical protein [Wenyingzhuangia fucanilytica]ANW95428.1 hypothetical protein AXE80_03650 [Wenyingzhuangia fucanilytica]
MRTTILYILLFIGLSSFAHNPKHCSIIIEQEGNSWQGQMNFSTTGLIDLIREATEHKNFKIDNTQHSYNIIKNYLEKSLRILVNSEVNLELHNFRIYPNQHATEINFDILNTPVRAELWQINIDFRNHHHIDKSLIFIINSHKNFFLLKHEKQILLRNKDHIMQKLKT